MTSSDADKPRGYLWHMLMSLGTRILMTVIRLVRNILLARLLGPADRGLFALLNTLPEMIYALTSGGLNTSVGYYAAKQRPMGVLVAQVLIYGCLLSGLLTVVGVSVLSSLDEPPAVVEQLGPWIWLLIPVVPIVVLKSGFLTLHNADGRVSAFNSLRLLESSIPLVLFLVLYLLWPDKAFTAALISWVLGLSAVSVVGWFLMKKYHSFRLVWRPGEQKTLLRYSGKSHPEMLFQQVLMRGDQLFVGVMLPAAALGHYAMAVAAVELLVIIPEAVTTPLMKRLLQQDAEMEAMTPFALRITATVMLAGCFGMAVLGEWLIVILFGVAYKPAYPALLLLLPGLLATCHASILRLDLLGKGRPGTLSFIIGVATLINLILNFVLIPRYGIEGAAVANSISYILVAAMMLALYCRLTGVSVFSTLIVLPSDIKRIKDLLQKSG